MRINTLTQKLEEIKSGICKTAQTVHNTNGKISEELVSNINEAVNAVSAAQVEVYAKVKYKINPAKYDYTDASTRIYRKKVERIESEKKASRKLLDIVSEFNHLEPVLESLSSAKLQIVLNDNSKVELGEKYEKAMSVAMDELADVKDLLSVYIAGEEVKELEEEVEDAELLTKVESVEETFEEPMEETEEVESEEPDKSEKEE